MRLLIACISIAVTIQWSVSAPTQRQESTNKILQHQKRAIIAYGRNVELECNFPTAVTRCAWSRQESLLEISERYSYVTGHGNSTSECSLHIQNFKKIDEGIWQCESMADSASGSILSTEVELSGTNNDLSQNPPTLEILNYDQFEKIYVDGDNYNRKLVKRSLEVDVFAYACLLEKVASAEIYWEVNGRRIVDTSSKDVLLESTSYSAIFLGQKSTTRNSLDLTLKAGDVIKCKAKFIEIAVPELSTTLKITDVSRQSINNIQEDVLFSTPAIIIIVLGAVIAILLVLLMILTSILVYKHATKCQKRPMMEERDSLQGIINQNMEYEALPEK